MFTNLWVAAHAEEEAPYWGLDLHELKGKIAAIKDKERREVMEFLFGSTLHFARSPTPEASPLFQVSRSLLWGFVGEIPEQLDAVRTERGLPLTSFTLDKEKVEENLKNELIAIIQPPLVDKNSKGRPAGKDPSKKQKSPEEAKAMLEEARQESLARISKQFEAKMVEELDSDYHKHDPVRSRQELTLFGDLIDRLNRKKRTENTGVITGRFSASVSLKLNPRLPKPTQIELAVEDFTEDSLNDLKTTLVELSLLYPKFVFVLLKVYDAEGKLVRLPARTIGDFLTKETELKIVLETGPFIADYEEKMENNFYEDGTFVVVGNSQSHEVFQSHSLSPSNIRFSKMWSDVSSASSQLSAQTNAFIETDVHGLFAYDPFVTALRVEETSFGGKIKTALDLIKGFFVFEKVPKPRSMLLGGELTAEKVWMAANAITYFSKVLLVGKLGLLWVCWNADRATKLLTKTEKGLFERLDNISKQMDKKIHRFNEFLCVKVLKGEANLSSEEQKSPQSLFEFHDDAKSSDLLTLKIVGDTNLELTPEGSFVYRSPSEGGEEPPAYRLLDYHPNIASNLAKELSGFENTLVFPH
jgi:hypothetical protein